MAINMPFCLNTVGSVRIKTNGFLGVCVSFNDASTQKGHLVWASISCHLQHTGGQWANCNK